MPALIASALPKALSLYANLFGALSSGVLYHLNHSRMPLTTPGHLASTSAMSFSSEARGSSRQPTRVSAVAQSSMDLGLLHVLGFRGFGMRETLVAVAPKRVRVQALYSEESPPEGKCSRPFIYALFHGEGCASSRADHDKCRAKIGQTRTTQGGWG